MAGRHCNRHRVDPTAIHQFLPGPVRIRDAGVGGYTARLFEARCRDRGDFGPWVAPNGGNEYRLPIAGTYHSKSCFLQELPLPV
jgi:hypothetical protein